MQDETDAAEPRCWPRKPEIAPLLLERRPHCRRASWSSFARGAGPGAVGGRLPGQRRRRRWIWSGSTRCRPSAPTRPLRSPAIPSKWTARGPWATWNWLRRVPHGRCAPGAARDRQLRPRLDGSCARHSPQRAKRLYLMLMALITLFVLFVATWIALFLAKQISVPSPRFWPPARCARATCSTA